MDVSIYHPVMYHFTRELVNELIATVGAGIWSDLVPSTVGKGAHGFLEYVPSYIRDGSSKEFTLSLRVTISYC